MIKRLWRMILVFLIGFSIIGLLIAMTIHRDRTIEIEQHTYTNPDVWNNAELLQEVADGMQEKIADLESKVQRAYDEYWDVLARQRELQGIN